MKKFLRNILFGNLPVSEYSTVAIEQQIYEKVFLRSGEDEFDVSFSHWLLCLDPIVFGIWFRKGEAMSPGSDETRYELRFTDGSAKAERVAVMSLVCVDRIEEHDGTLFLLRLNKVDIRHVSFVRTLLLYYKYYKKPEQNFHKLKSYSAAYSYPRRVRLVSFQDGSWYNIFPMDLLGDISSCRRYVFGLRHSNVTLPRIIEAGKIVVSEIPFEYKDIIYQLGKHHRKPLSEIGAPFKTIQSDQFGFPVPEWANSYKEIRIMKTLNLGSHMLLWGEEMNGRLLNDSHGHLYHVHFLHYLHQSKKGVIYRLV